MAAASEILLLKSTLQIQHKSYSVKLTPTEIYWESLTAARVPGGPYSQPLVNDIYVSNAESKQNFDSAFVSSETEPVCEQLQISEKTSPAVIVKTVPIEKSQSSCSAFACCPLWQHASENICDVCQKPFKAENQLIKLTNITAVRLGGEDSHVVSSTKSSRGTIELGTIGAITSFTVYHVRPVGRHRWRNYCIVFSTNDASVVSQWVDKITEILAWPEFNRPKSLLVFVNPIAGRRRAAKIYKEKVAPLFELARITTELVMTEYRNHARDILQQIDLDNFDGVVSVGGDGMFAEVTNGLLARTLKMSGIEQPTVDGILPQPKWRIGIIPAGSTDTVSFSTQGVNDPITSALHIILGDNVAIDVGTLFHGSHFIKYNVSLLGYGYYGDCILDSESNRWMGPKRYDWEGFKKILANRSYEGEISFLPSPNKESHPRDQMFCKAGCVVCQSNRRQHRPASVVNDSISDEDVQWQTVRGRFSAINSFLISCRCRYALEGPAPSAHLGDGCTDLIIIRHCSRLDYTRHLYRCSDPNADQFDFPFIQTFRVSQFRFRPGTAMDELAVAVDDLVESSSEVKINSSGQQLHEHGAVTSVWNCDGEVVDEPSIDFRVHPQTIRLFARGIDDERCDVNTGCLCCSTST